MRASVARPALAIALLIAGVLLAGLLLHDNRPQHENATGIAGAGDASEERAPLAEPSAPSTPGVADEPSEQRTLASPTGVTVAIVDPRGQAVAEARWVAFRGERVLASGVTAGDGIARVELSSPTEPAADFELAADHKSFPPARWTLAPAPERQSVELGRGAVVSGIVRVDGLPRADFPLRLAAKPAFWQADELPEPVAFALFGRPQARTEITTTSVARGEFRFEGLRSTWSGEIRWPNEYGLASDPPPGSIDAVLPRASLKLDAPAEGLMLDLHTSPTITGRVVTADGLPVPRGRVEAAWWSDAASGSFLGAAQEDGRFRLPFGMALPARIEIRVAEEDGAGSAKHTFDVPAALRHWDAGDLAVRATRVIEVAVRNEKGEPIRGARLAEAGSESASSMGARTETDVDGHASPRIDVARTALRVEAAGYDHTVVDVDAGVERIDVVLARAAVLIVELVPADVALSVGIASREEPFLDADDEPSWMPAIVAEGIQVTVTRGASVYRGSRDGRFELAGVRAGIPMRVVVADAFARPLAERDVLPLEPGEQRLVRIDVGTERLPPPERRALFGRVVNAAGAPVPGAMVTVCPVGGGDGRGRGTDAQGSFRHEGLTGESVKVEVDAPGHALLTIDEQPLTGEPVEYVVDTGRDVRVRVVDARGAAVTGARVLGPGMHWFLDGGAEEVATGEYLLAHMPSAAFDFTVSLAGREFDAHVDAGVDEARVDVPAFQACWIDFTGRVDLLAASSEFSVVLRSVGDTPACYLGTRIAPSAEPATELLVERVFPGRYEVFVEKGEDHRVRLSDPIEVEISAEVPARVAVVLREP